jgi:LPXTG-site transpeptidase (sortase) family protein
MENKTTRRTRDASHLRNQVAHRRAYLDTYARQRGGGQVQAGKVVQPATALPADSKMLVGSDVSANFRPQMDFIQPQQPAASTHSSSAYFEAAQPPQPKVLTKVHSEASRRSYLDTLTRRHESAVAAELAAQKSAVRQDVAAQAAPVLSDPVAEARIEANLEALYSGSLTDMIAKNTASASASHVRTIVASALACGVLSVGIFSFMSKYDYQPVVAQPIGAPVIEVESSNSQNPTGTPLAQNTTSGPVAVDPSHPVRVVISSIGVNAQIDGLGTTPEGLIAVPKAYGVVGWYNKGAVPGKPGPAVLVGHYAGGGGAVFDKLENLKNGDLITTTNGRGESFTYRVTTMQKYHRDAVPMAQIFKSSDESRLEIITCAGKWQAQTYTDRLIVSAELVK